MAGYRIWKNVKEMQEEYSKKLNQKTVYLKIQLYNRMDLKLVDINKKSNQIEKRKGNKYKNSRKEMSI